MLDVRISRPTYVFSKVPQGELIGLQEAANQLGMPLTSLKSLVASRRLDVVEDMQRLESTRNRSYLFRVDFDKLKAERGG